MEVKAEEKIRMTITVMSFLFFWFAIVGVVFPMYYAKHVLRIYIIALGHEQENLAVDITSDPSLSMGFGLLACLYVYAAISGPTRLLVLSNIIFTLFVYSFRTLKKIR